MQSGIQKATRAMRKAIPAVQSDPNRPRYHFLPPANWMNDPNGTIFHNGEYHLFYQLNPAKAKWGNLHWGHAKSTDLVHWEHLPIALAPDGAPKESHCWSGCCVIADDGTPSIFYTSINPQSLLARAKRYSQQWMATGSPDLLTWQKHPANPILSEDIHGEQTVQQWRDPYIWKEGGQWYMILAGEYPEEKLGRVFLYRSPDLLDWKYIGLLAQDSENRGRGWECPNYFRLGDRYVLVVSPYGPVIYSVGDFDGERHHGEAWHILDHGRDFYATNTFVDDRGRTIMVGWVKARGKGWAGCSSLPRTLELEEGRLTIKPVVELQTLRGSHQHFERELKSVVEKAGTAPLFGEQVEIRASFHLQEVESLGFELSDDDKTHRIAFDVATHTLQVMEARAQLQWARDSSKIDLHIFIDHCLVEVFVNQREAFTAAFDPKLAGVNALKITPFASRARGRFSIDFWQLEEAPVAGEI